MTEAMQQHTHGIGAFGSGHDVVLVVLRRLKERLAEVSSLQSPVSSLSPDPAPRPSSNFAKSNKDPVWV